jgi:HTH-type transcriptional regulator / antitoxin MqsA
MKCPMCGASELLHDVRDLLYTYKGEITIISAVIGDFCPACDDSIMSLAEANRASCAMLAFNKQVDLV